MTLMIEQSEGTSGSNMLEYYRNVGAFLPALEILGRYRQPRDSQWG